MQIRGLKKQNEILHHALQKSKDKEKALAKKVIDIELGFRREMVTMQSSSRRREEEGEAAGKSQIQGLEKELRRFRIRCKQAEQKEEELNTVQGNIERQIHASPILKKNLSVSDKLQKGQQVKLPVMLMHIKDMLDDPEGCLNHYKNNTEDFESIKNLLKPEEEAHGGSVQEYLRLQKEVKTSQTLRHQLKQYMVRASTAETLLVKCKQDHFISKQQLLDVHYEMGILEKNALSQQDKIKDLTQKLNEHCLEKSQINPQEIFLYQHEIKRLKKENIKLSRSVGIVSKEEKQVDPLDPLSPTCPRKQLQTTQFDLESFANVKKEEILFYMQEARRLKEENIRLSESTATIPKLERDLVESKSQTERNRYQFLATRNELLRTKEDLEGIMMEFYQALEMFAKVGSLRKQCDDGAPNEYQNQPSMRKRRSSL
jgi:hypothetical protein